MRLKKIFKNKLSELQDKEIQTSLYDSPNWALLQADIAGQKRILKLVEHLLSHVKE